MVTYYTTGVNIDPDVAESIYWQQVYNILARYNIPYTDKLYVKAYSHFGMINGFKIVITILSIVSY
jgi:hypothetical protein